LNRLASRRAEYSALFGENAQRAKQLEAAEKELTDARAAQAGAAAAPLVTRVDSPDPGSKPVGPGKKTLIVIGVVGGFFVGAGWLLLTTAFGPVRTEPRSTKGDERDIDPLTETVTAAWMKDPAKIDALSAANVGRN
jgi:hypothetical protein